MERHFDSSCRSATSVGEDANRGYPIPVGSRDQFFDDLSMHVGEAEVAAGVAIGELGVVEAHELEDRGVQVVDADPVLDGFEAEVVGGAMDVAAAHAAASKILAATGDSEYDTEV